MVRLYKYVKTSNFLIYREEGTIPYIPEIPVNTEAILNYNQSLYDVRHIHTAPAGLESTSLVLVYGLGMVYTTTVKPVYKGHSRKKYGLYEQITVIYI